MLRATIRSVLQQYRTYRLRRRFKDDFQQFVALAKAEDKRFEIAWSDRFPCLYDATGTTDYDRQYVLHTGWAARILARTKPARHVDIGSSMYFVSIASAIVPFDFYDFRPTPLPLPGVSSGSADLTKLRFANGEISSLSCMHVIEHVGLGRYGDNLDPAGDLKAASELQRVLAKGGQLVMVAPVGRPRIMFNAHRIYSYEQVLEMFASLELCEFSLIPDGTLEPELMVHAPPEIVRSQSCACGCFWFVKK